MTHSIASLRYLPRWQGYTVGWEEVAAGLALFPQSLYMFLLSLPPLFTSTVLLLDSAPAVSNVVIGAGITIVVAVVGWLLNRTIAGFDTATKETKEAVHALTLLVTEMRLERKDDRVLTNYLKERQDKLEKENDVLRNSFAAYDKHMAVALYRKEHPDA